MRSRRAATALAALTAGVTAAVTAAVALQRRADRRPIAAIAPPVGVQAQDAVILPFVRPTVPAAPVELPPARCGDSGGRTKAGAPCAARATSSGRCHHHPIAA